MLFTKWYAAAAVTHTIKTRKGAFMKKRLVFLTVLLSVSLLVGCGKKVDGEASVQSVSMICGIGSTGLVDRFAGVVSPKSETTIQKDEEQLVSAVKVKVGDTVKKGQVLFVYDMEQTNLNLEKAQLELEQLENSLQMQKNEKASLEKERASASQDQKLSYSLEIQEAETAILEANYNISAKKKEIQKLEDTQKHLKVKAPIKGRIQSINTDNTTDSMGMPQPYITIVETGTYRVKGYVNESNADAIAEGTPVLLKSRTDDSVWHGTIETIDWENASSSQSDNMYYDSSTSDDTTTSSKYPFYVKLEEDEGLLLGQHVYIEPNHGQDSTEQETNEQENQLQLPSVYLNNIDSDPWVWAQSKKGTLEKRSVTLGTYQEEMDTYSIETGLTVDDYIAFPDETLQEGMTCVSYDEASFNDYEDMGEGNMDNMYDENSADMNNENNGENGEENSPTGSGEE